MNKKHAMLLILLSLAIVPVGCFITQSHLKAQGGSTPTLPNGAKVKRVKLKIELPANNHLSRSSFIDRDLVIRNLSTNPNKGWILKSFKLMTYGKYLTSDSTLSRNDVIFLNRIVAVIVVDYPRGLRASNADYLHARVEDVIDAQTQRPIMYTITGKVDPKYEMVIFHGNGK
jgi:hypothetical protein